MTGPHCISTERLEDYQGFGLSALDVSIEEHLRECQVCRDRLESLARFVALCKGGAIRKVK